MTVSGLTVAVIMGAMLLFFIFSGYYLFAALGGVALILQGLRTFGGALVCVDGAIAQPIRRGGTLI